MHRHDGSDNDGGTNADGLEPDAIRTIAHLAGIELSNERVSALVPQVEAHLQLMKSVIIIDARATEPALELRLREGIGITHD